MKQGILSILSVIFLVTACGAQDDILCKDAMKYEIRGDIPALESLASKGDACAQRSLGKIVFFGTKNVASDKPRGIALLESSAKQGLDVTQYELALIYLSDVHEVLDKSKAVYWLTEAAELGNIPSQTKLGMLLLKDADFEDRDKGLYWLKTASANGGIEATLTLERLGAAAASANQQGREQ